MEITLTIPDGDVDGMSAQWQDRVERKANRAGTPLETTAEHVERAYQTYLANELHAARVVQAGKAVKAATNDADLGVALVAERKLRQAK